VPAAVATAEDQRPPPLPCPEPIKQHTHARTTHNKPDRPPQIKTAGAKVAQVGSAAFGLLSLSLAILDFLRLHPRSFWARATPPHRLFIGLVDVSRATWGTSLLIALFAFCALTTRALMYIQLIIVTVNRSFFDVRFNFGGSASAAAIVGAAAQGVPPTFEMPAGLQQSAYQAFSWESVATASPFGPSSGVYQAYAYRLTPADMYGPASPSTYYMAAVNRLATSGRMLLRALLPVALLAAFVINALLLAPMRSLFIFPAAFVSMFINVPWIAARPGSAASAKPWAAWPSWVMAFLYVAPIMALYCVGFADANYVTGFLGIDYVSPCTVKGRYMVRFDSQCSAAAGGCAPKNTTVPVPSGGRLMLWGGRTTQPGPNLAAFMALMPICAGLELILFLALSGATVRRRRERKRCPSCGVGLHVHGGSLKLRVMQDPLDIPGEVPTLMYRFSLWRPYFLSAYQVGRQVHAPPVMVEHVPGAGGGDGDELGGAEEGAWKSGGGAGGGGGVGGAVACGGAPAEHIPAGTLPGTVVVATGGGAHHLQHQQQQQDQQQQHSGDDSGNLEVVVASGAAATAAAHGGTVAAAADRRAVTDSESEVMGLENDESGPLDTLVPSASESLSVSLGGDSASAPSPAVQPPRSRSGGWRRGGR